MRFSNPLTPRTYTVLNGDCLFVLRDCDVLDIYQESNPGVKKRPVCINGFIVTRTHARPHTHTHTHKHQTCGGCHIYFPFQQIIFFCTFLQSLTITKLFHLPFKSLLFRHSRPITPFPRNVTCTAETQMLNKLRVK